MAETVEVVIKFSVMIVTKREKRKEPAERVVRSWDFDIRGGFI